MKTKADLSQLSFRTALHVNVLYSKSGDQIVDCTNGGVSSIYERLVLVPEGVETPNPNLCRLPILKVMRRGSYIYAEPISAPGPKTIGRYMAGGNFVYSSDSRYREWVCEFPIAVHDRTETPEQNAFLSV